LILCFVAPKTSSNFEVQNHVYHYLQDHSTLRVCVSAHLQLEKWAKCQPKEGYLINRARNTNGWDSIKKGLSFCKCMRKSQKEKENSWRRNCHESRVMLIKIMAKIVSSKINTTNYLTPWSRILLERLNIAWLVKKFLAFLGT
jgi:hypothetical protein